MKHIKEPTDLIDKYFTDTIVIALRTHYTDGLPDGRFLSITEAGALYNWLKIPSGYAIDIENVLRCNSTQEDCPTEIKD